MLNLFRAMRFGAGLVAAAVILAVAPTPSHAETGSVRLTIVRAGFIVGVGGGSGTLSFHGHSYPLSVGGVSVGTFGATRADLVGHAYHLRTAADIAGTYTALSGGIAVAGGDKSARLQNARGVVLDLQGPQVGFELSLSLSGATISLQ